MKKILSFIIAAVSVFGIASCTPEEIFTKDGKAPLESPVISVGEVTANSISFYWTAIDNANQYYYKVVNPAGYIMAKGETKDTYVDVKGLKYSTEFSVYVSAIPAADVASTYCASEPAEMKITTDDPVIINYEWVQDGKAWFYSGDDKWNVVNITFGREAETGHFVITSYCGAEGFDFYFDMTKFEGSYPFQFDNGMKNMSPVTGQAIDMEGPLGSRPDFHLAHGLGGKAATFNIFYGDGGSYEYGVIDPTGGYIDFWTTNFDEQWCGYRVEYGDYKAPEPEPWVPDADMSFAWSADGEIFIDGEATKTYATISYTGAAEAEYTISGWYGVEGYDLVFTRNQEDGTWVINKDKSSAYAGVCPGDGLYGYLHGADGQSKIIWINDDADSGLSGNNEEGKIWIDILDPDGNEVTYTLEWPAKFFTWTKDGEYYSGRHDNSEKTTLGYDEDSDLYTLVIPQYDNAKVLFKTNEAGEFIPVEGGNMLKSDDTWWWIDYSGTWVFVKIPTSSVDLAAGKVILDVWNGSDEWTDTFTFAALPGVDALVGTYTQASEGWWWSGSEWTYTYWTNDVTITKADESSIQIVGLIDCTDPIIGAVNAKTSTITMAANQAFQGSFFFKSYGTGEDVTASYDSDLNITFSVNWSVTNEGGSLYWDNIITSLSKK